MVVPHIHQGWHGDITLATDEVIAARGESTLGRRIHRYGHIAADCIKASLTAAAQSWYGFQQPLCIRVERIIE